MENIDFLTGVLKDFYSSKYCKSVAIKYQSIKILAKSTVVTLSLILDLRACKHAQIQIYVNHCIMYQCSYYL